MTLEVWLSIGLALCLAWASWIDLRLMILPDWLTLPLAVAGLALAALQGPSFGERLIGAAAGYGAFFLLSWLYRRLRGRDGLGLGDAKLLGAAGAWLGWQPLPSVVLLAAVSGLVWAAIRRIDPERPIPFGPFLALAFWLVWWFGPLELPGN